MQHLEKYAGIPAQLIIGILLLMIHACSPEEHAAVPFELSRPENFVAMHHPANNPLTEEGIALGKRLFHETALSADGSLSCASCHQPERAFTDGKVTSVGVYGRRGFRNTPSILNTGYFYRGLFWDARVESLEELVMHPVTDPREMGADWKVVEDRLGEQPAYREAFYRAFGWEKKGSIPRKLVAKALAQYLRTLQSVNSKFDREQRGEAVFTASEKRGWAIFFDATDSLPHGECSHCHVDPLFTDLNLHNTGLDPEGEEKDPGRAAVSGRPFDRAKFKTPSLRNVALTAPYMHDGRFATLPEVIDHYRSGGHPGENVSPNVRELKLEAGHQADLIAFLKTLTDSVYVQSKYIAAE